MGLVAAITLQGKPSHYSAFMTVRKPSCLFDHENKTIHMTIYDDYGDES